LIKVKEGGKGKGEEEMSGIRSIIMLCLLLANPQECEGCREGRPQITWTAGAKRKRQGTVKKGQIIPG